MEQINIFDFNQIVPTRILNPAHISKMPTKEAFYLFHKKNPHVYKNLQYLALSLVRRGRKKIGINMLFETLRWMFAMRTDDPNCHFKLNNNYAPYYSRLLMLNTPELENKIEIRGNVTL